MALIVHFKVAAWWTEPYLYPWQYIPFGEKAYLCTVLSQVIRASPSLNHQNVTADNKGHWKNTGYKRQRINSFTEHRLHKIKQASFIMYTLPKECASICAGLSRWFNTHTHESDCQTISCKLTSPSLLSIYWLFFTPAETGNSLCGVTQSVLQPWQRVLFGDISFLSLSYPLCFHRCFAEHKP